MSTFLNEWGAAIIIALLVLVVLSLAEWRDNRDGLYDTDDEDDWTDDDTGLCDDEDPYIGDGPYTISNR